MCTPCWSIFVYTCTFDCPSPCLLIVVFVSLQQNRLVPGLTLDCVVEFYPDEFRYYYDCIRIHTVVRFVNCFNTSLCYLHLYWWIYHAHLMVVNSFQGNENLIIPIHAFPVMNTSDFPSQMDFGMVPLGQSWVIPSPFSFPGDGQSTEWSMFSISTEKWRDSHYGVKHLWTLSSSWCTPNLILHL